VVQPESVDPYADPDYKVHRRARQPGSALCLKQTLLQRSEAKVRALLRSAGGKRHSSAA
jgi:hypothetical protein